VGLDAWLTTDTHLGHDALVEDKCRPAGFSEKIIRALRNVLKFTDVLIHLGDVSFEREDFWNRELCSLPGKKWLVNGNHDKRSESWYLERGWDWVGNSMTLTAFGKRILLSHAPQLIEGTSMIPYTTPDGGTGTHMASFKYDLNIHGHFHDFGLEKVAEMEPHYYNLLTPRHYLISLEELNYQPIKLKRVIELCNKRIKQ
jgi:calcineurin-like phosphoesterase family protein